MNAGFSPSAILELVHDPGDEMQGRAARECAMRKAIHGTATGACHAPLRPNLDMA